ncbi:inactive peptidyl-prolyl cis-trans isomerase FKBP6-like [Nilaparvata lugens]|uniref:inactive peptidyl-prolyl cis-trans isomerase FKBP6-like n=1 Tax=Nilaparvata lugens TaxID=108931 RepID=UPI00193CFD15|nr:inactive peptidyl-prolyl cis-trans isomerase FKBP6-like [Nilaparvata lugens]
MSESSKENISMNTNRLTKPICLRELTDGREFEITAGDYCEGEDDYNLIKDEFPMDEIEKYVNFDTLDVDVDEEGKVVCFADLRQKMSPVTTDKRIMKRMIKQGMGEMISNAGVVYYHYSAYVNLQEEPFDNSYLRRHRRPERLVLGKGEVLIGVELALKTMKKGEVSQFIVEPEYAFGKLGCPPRVPPESTVLFEIEVIDYTELSDCTEPEAIDIEETTEEKYNRLYKAAKDNRALGNDFFKKLNYRMAAVRYRRSRDILLEAICKNEEDEKVKNHLLAKVLSNLVISYSMLKKPNLVCMTCRDAFYFNEEEATKNPKLYYFWGLALMEFGDYELAKIKLKKALRLQPNSMEIKEALKKLDDKQKQYKDTSRIIFQKALGFSGETEKKAVDEEVSENTSFRVFRCEISANAS